MDGCEEGTRRIATGRSLPGPGRFKEHCREASVRVHETARPSRPERRRAACWRRERRAGGWEGQLPASLRRGRLVLRTRFDVASTKGAKGTGRRRGGGTKAIGEGEGNGMSIRKAEGSRGRVQRRGEGSSPGQLPRRARQAERGTETGRKRKSRQEGREREGRRRDRHNSPTADADSKDENLLLAIKVRRNTAPRVRRKIARQTRENEKGKTETKKKKESKNRKEKARGRKRGKRGKKGEQNERTRRDP